MAFKPKIKEKAEVRVKWYKDRKFLVYLIGVFILLIMIASSLNIGQNNNASKYKYNGFEFTKTDNGWVTYVNGQQVSFTYGPKDVEDISMPSININSPKAYVMFSPKNYSVNDYQIQRLVGILKFNNINAFPACDSGENCPDIPVIDCNNPNFVFYFKESNETKAYKDKNCVILQESSTGQAMLIDRVAYSLFKII